MGFTLRLSNLILFSPWEAEQLCAQKYNTFNTFRTRRPLFASHPRVSPKVEPRISSLHTRTEGDGVPGCTGWWCIPGCTWEDGVYHGGYPAVVPWWVSRRSTMVGYTQRCTRVRCTQRCTGGVCTQQCTGGCVPSGVLGGVYPAVYWVGYTQR